MLHFSAHPGGGGSTRPPRSRRGIVPAPRVVCGRAAARRAHSARFILAPSTDCFYIFVQAQPAGEGKGQMRAHV